MRGDEREGKREQKEKRRGGEGEKRRRKGARGVGEKEGDGMVRRRSVGKEIESERRPGKVQLN